jgi:peroxiredoxin
MAKELNVGDVAPDFTLKDHHGEEVRLRELKGKKVVLGFHPLAWTRVCAMQMNDLEANRDRMEKLGAVAYGISIDSTPSKKAWAASLGIEHTQLLSDFWPHGAVASEYGIFREADGFSERAVVILDGSGKVQYKKVYPMKQVPDIEEIMTELEKM